MVDEAIRWKLAEYLPKKDAFHIAQAMLRAWFRYFGPPKCIKFDQEGGVRADDFAVVRDRYSMHRPLGGSDDSGKHTVTGLAERHIGLIKTSALKCKATAAKQGLDVPDEDIVFECTMCQNFMLEYGGFTPLQRLQGQNPRGFFDHGTNSTLAIDGARDTTPDTFESYLRLRMLAKAAVQKAVNRAAHRRGEQHQDTDPFGRGKVATSSRLC